jgi:hypothetical protein
MENNIDIKKIKHDQYMKKYRDEHKLIKKEYNKRYYENKKYTDIYKTDIVVCQLCNKCMQERSMKKHLLINCKIV